MARATPTAGAGPISLASRVCVTHACEDPRLAVQFRTLDDPSLGNLLTMTKAARGQKRWRPTRSLHASIVPSSRTPPPLQRAPHPNPCFSDVSSRVMHSATHEQ
jgi:hypothetical protein